MRNVGMVELWKDWKTKYRKQRKRNLSLTESPAFAVGYGGASREDTEKKSFALQNRKPLLPLLALLNSFRLRSGIKHGE